MVLDRARTAARVGGAVAVVALLSDDEGVVLCPFRRATHGYCPLCGGTRAAARLATGDVEGAWDRHPLVVLLGVQVAAALVAWLTIGRVRPTTAVAWWTRWQTALLVANLAAATAIWGLRLAGGDVPAPSTLDAPVPLPW
ncbi:MAG: DUF2752 domain-containing protein [Acidimicrobiales bacterium]